MTGLQGPILEVDAQRRRWTRQRDVERLLDPSDAEFGLGGLGVHLGPHAVRMLFLPGDPLQDVVPINDETMEWLKKARPGPFGGQPINWGGGSRTTSQVAVLLRHDHADRPWDLYAALHRNGSIEVGTSRCAAELRDARFFWLRKIVAVACASASLQKDAAEQWQVQGPWELAVSLTGTLDAGLAGFAEGWADVGAGLHEFHTCLESGVLIRRELSDDEVLDAEALAVDIGDRVENCFGTTGRRHLAHRGDFEGRFDLRQVTI